MQNTPETCVKKYPFCFSEKNLVPPKNGMAPTFFEHFYASFGTLFHSKWSKTPLKIYIYTFCSEFTLMHFSAFFEFNPNPFQKIPVLLFSRKTAFQKSERPHFLAFFFPKIFLKKTKINKKGKLFPKKVKTMLLNCDIRQKI
jgi:hypothetical protein